MRSARYIVYGRPLSRKCVYVTAGYNQHRADQLRWRIELEKQHNDRPLFNGPIALKVDLYFPIPPMSRYKINPGSSHSVKPDVYSFVEFIHAIARNYLYSENAVISTLTCRKLYDERPRTEFTITEIL